ncbi:MAG: hypothetical protein ACLQIQ_17400 [Beijerinckiaceae bacterium]
MESREAGAIPLLPNRSFFVLSGTGGVSGELRDMKFQTGDSTDKALCVALKHEFLRYGVVVIVRCDLTTDPPAHCRLVSDHDLFEIVAWLDCTVLASTVMGW